jgi:hypothetical protein
MRRGDASDPKTRKKENMGKKNLRLRNDCSTPAHNTRPHRQNIGRFGALLRPGGRFAWENTGVMVAMMPFSIFTGYFEEIYRKPAVTSFLASSSFGHVSDRGRGVLRPDPPREGRGGGLG